MQNNLCVQKYKFPWRRGISDWWLESLFQNESCADVHRFPNCVRILIHSRGDTYPCNLFWIVSALDFYAQGTFFVCVTSLWASSLTGNGKKSKRKRWNHIHMHLSKVDYTGRPGNSAQWRSHLVDNLHFQCVISQPFTAEMYPSGTEQNVHEDDKYSQKDIYVSSNMK